MLSLCYLVLTFGTIREPTEGKGEKVIVANTGQITPIDTRTTPLHIPRLAYELHAAETRTREEKILPSKQFQKEACFLVHSPILFPPRAL